MNTEEDEFRRIEREAKRRHPSKGNDMTDLRQAAQQALEALIDAANVLSAPMFPDAVAALRTALEQSEPPPEWEGINNIIAEYGLQAIDFVADWKATLGQAEPTCPSCKAAVLYECVACSSNNYPPQQQERKKQND